MGSTPTPLPPPPIFGGGGVNRRGFTPPLPETGSGGAGGVWVDRRSGRGPKGVSSPQVLRRGRGARGGRLGGGFGDGGDALGGFLAGGEAGDEAVGTQLGGVGGVVGVVDGDVGAAGAAVGDGGGVGILAGLAQQPVEYDLDHVRVRCVLED